MPLLADRVLESTTTTGTGTFALGGVLTGYRSFNSSFTNGDVVYYTADNGQGEWEVGYGTVGTGTLSRDTVLESSNANAKVAFSAGTKRLFCTAPAKQLPPNQTGNSGKYLTTNGSDLSWGTVSAGVTSVGVSVPTGFSVSGTPVTSSGTIAISTALSGVLKGTGSGFTAATAGSDYVAPSGALGTPSSGTLTYCTGLPISTGVSGLGSGVATFLATPSSANLASAVTGETGSGALVFGTSPTLATPINTGLRETSVNPSISGGTLPVDCSSGNVFLVNMTQSITAFSFSNVPAYPTSFSLTLMLLSYGYGTTVTWGSSVKWPSGTAPTLTNTYGKMDTFVLTTYDGGSSWYAFTAGLNA